MQDVLIRIKRAVLAGRYAFSEKARVEMKADGLAELDIAYVIQSTNLDGLAIYTKGKLAREADTDVYYFLISSKRAI